MATMAELRKIQEQANLALTETIAKSNKSDFKEDERIWKLIINKTDGTGRAKIRFLSSHPSEKLAYVKSKMFNFKGPGGKWYMARSRTSIGEPDPVQNTKNRLWNSEVDSDKEVNRTLKPIEYHYCNILVLEDPANPENEGKVFLFRFSKQILKKILEKIDKDYFPTETKFNPFDPFNGADFVIIVYMEKKKYHENDTNSNKPNYEKSYFIEQSPLGSDQEIKKYMEGDLCYKLEEFTVVKPYDELEKRLVEVLGPRIGSISTVENSDIPVAQPPNPKPTISEAVVDVAPEPNKPVLTSDAEAATDDDLAFFEQYSK